MGDKEDGMRTGENERAGEVLQEEEEVEEEKKRRGRGRKEEEVGRSGR